jgi:hypothetical protein
VTRWLLDFVGDIPDSADDSIAGFVRLELREAERIAWYWTYLVGVPGIAGVIVVRDHEVLLPRQGLEIRADGLWAELTCETPREHWTFGLESFGVRLDDGADALRPGEEIGERVAVGLDIEWEVGAAGPPAGVVHGDVLVGRERFELDGTGFFYDDATPEPVFSDSPEAEVVATVFVPEGGGAYVERRLVRSPDGHRWSFERHKNRR